MLAQEKCVPCREGTPAATPDEVQTHLKTLPGWELALNGRAIKRRFAFDNFLDALALVNKAGAVAEEEGHHPDILLGWGYAEFVLWTHSIGGLHHNDFIMAAKIDAAAK